MGSRRRFLFLPLLAALALLVLSRMVAREDRTRAEGPPPRATSSLQAAPGDAASTGSPAETPASPGAGGGFVARIEVEEDWGTAPFTVKFSPVVGGADAVAPYAYTWHFGDGSPPSHEQSARHVYTVEGAYWATLWVRDATGKRAGFSAEIWVEAGEEEATTDLGEPFTAAVGLDSDWGEVPHTVKLWALPDGAGAKAPFKYTWEFGDGSPPSTEATPTHVYRSANEFWVLLILEAADGRTARAYRSIWVEEP